MGAMRLLAGVLVLQLVLAGTLIVLVATDNVPFVCGEDGAAAARPRPRVPSGHVDALRPPRRLRLGEAPGGLGPRPAGSAPRSELAERLRRALPGGRFQAVPGGPAQRRRRRARARPKRIVVVGAHYDTKDMPGFVGANDGAGGTAVMVQLARTLKPRTLRADAGVHRLRRRGGPRRRPGRRTSPQRACAAARWRAKRYKNAAAMVLLDFVGQRNLPLLRRGQLRLGPVGQGAHGRRAKAGVGRVFPPTSRAASRTTTRRSCAQGVPAMDLIDFDYPCFHRTCDDLAQIHEPQPGRHR